MDETQRLERRKAFIDRHRHELAGLILDGATFNRTGGELALWCRGIMHRCDQKLAQMFDDLFPLPKATNDTNRPNTPTPPKNGNTGRSG